MKKFYAGLLLAACTGAALAKLPAPNLTDEAKAKAAEAAAKTAWSAKVDTYQLCQAQDRAAAYYFRAAKAAGKEPKPAAATAACADPGAFAYVPAEAAKPLEAAGAHSPAGTAASPPSGSQPAAQITPGKKS